MPQAFTTNPHLILPVSKYSFSLESNGVTKFSWKHAHNAFLIFDSFRSKLDLPSTQSSKCLKVVKGTDTLEFVDIENKARQASEAIERAKILKSTLKPDQIPSFALFRRNARSIAIRYQVPDNHTRRIQLKFNSYQDFDAALAALAELGLPHYDYTSSNIEEESQMPQQAFTTASVFEAQLATSSDGVGNELLHSLPTGHSRGPEIDIGHFSSDLLSSENLFSDPPPSEHRPPSSSLKRPNTAAPATCSTQTQHCRPSSAHPKSIPPSREAKDSQPSAKLPQHRRSEDLGPRTSVSPTPASNRRQADIISQHRQPALPTHAPRDALQSQDSHYSASEPLKRTSDNFVLPSTDKSILPHVETASVHFQRPLTTPNSQIRNELQEVPPRRELPFQRKSTTLGRKETLNNLNKPDTAFPTLSSSNKANMVSISATSTRDAIDKPSVPPTGSSKSISKDRTVNIISHVDCSQQIGSSNVTYEALWDVSRNQNPVESQVQEPSERTEQHLKNVTTADTVRNPIVQTPGCAISNRSLETPIDQIVDRLMSYVDSSGTDKESLGSYARLSNEERKTIIEGAVIDLIKDDNFAQLCEDLHGTWQRIGLGP